MLSLMLAAAIASSVPPDKPDVVTGVPQDCFLATNRSRAILGYSGLSGEGSTQAFIRESQPDPAPTSYAGDVRDNIGDAIGYTRIRAEFVPCSDSSVRDYARESRHWYTRLISALKTEKTLTVRITVSGDFTDVSNDTVLASITRTSSKTGDEWDTHVTESTILLPYFRVGQRTSISIAPTFLASSDYSTSVVSDVLAVVQSAVKAINPAATLITSANQPQFTKAANFVDTTVSGLLHRKIGEDSISVRDLLQLPPGGEIARILLLAPDADETVTSKRLLPLGIWIIRADPIVGSVFGRVKDGAFQLTSASPDDILITPVADGKSLNDALLATSNVSKARDAYLAAKAGAPATKAGAAFCEAVRTEASKLWFTPTDAGVITWAMATKLTADSTARTALFHACSTVDHFPTTV